MPERSKTPRRPRAANQLARQIMLEATAQVPKQRPDQPIELHRTPTPVAVRAARRPEGGGPARAAKLSPKKRPAIAAKAAQARWGKKP